MKKLLARLLLSVLLAIGTAPVVYAQVGPANQIPCDKTATFTGGGAAAIVITHNSTANISVCGWHITSTSSTTTTFQITTGSGSACGTGTVNITPALNVTITAPSADHIDYAAWSAGLNNDVCVNAPATVTGLLYYSQRS